MDRLKQKRAALRTQVTKLISEANSALESHAEEKALNVLTARLSALKIKLNEADAAIEPLVLEHEAEQNYASTIEYDDSIVTCIARLGQEAQEAQKAKKENGERSNAAAAFRR